MFSLLWTSPTPELPARKVELIGNVVRVGTTSLQVRVELYVEQMYSDERLLAVTGSFTFVAVDEQRRPTPLRPAAVAAGPAAC